MTAQVMLDDRREIWVTWLDLPWDVVRQSISAEMRRRDMSWDDLLYELRSSGYHVSRATIGNWLGGHNVKGPTLEALQALAGVFGRVRSGDWTKGADLSLDEEGTDPDSPRGQLKRALGYDD